MSHLANQSKLSDPLYTSRKSTLALKADSAESTGVGGSIKWVIELVITITQLYLQLLLNLDLHPNEAIINF